MDRKTLRRLAIERRLSLSEEERRKRSEILKGRILALDSYLSSATIAAYFPIRGEIDILPVLEKAKGAGKKILLPRIVSPGRMVFLLFEETEKLVLNGYGIPEPPFEEEKAVDDIDLMLVPLVACHDLFRLGYGGNYYNDYLSRHKVKTTIGIGYQEGVVEEDFRTERDIPLSLILTA